MFKEALSHCSRPLLSPPAILTIPPGTPRRWPMHRTHAGHACYAREVCLQGAPLALATGVPWLRIEVRHGKVAFPPCTPRARFCLRLSLRHPRSGLPPPLTFLSSIALHRVDYLDSPLPRDTASARRRPGTTTTRPASALADSQPRLSSLT